MRRYSPSPEDRFNNNVPNRLLEQTRLSILNWNPGPRRGKEGAIEKHIAEKWHIIALQEAIEYLQRERDGQVPSTAYKLIKHETSDASKFYYRVLSANWVLIPLTHQLHVSRACVLLKTNHKRYCDFVNKSIADCVATTRRRRVSRRHTDRDHR